MPFLNMGGNTMNKNILAIGIVFLFVCSAFIPMSLGINTRITNTREQTSTFSRGKTLYVGGKGEGKTNIMTSWYEQAKLLASDGADDDDFGFSVSLDGDTALIGAFCDDPYGDRSGSAYVFKGNGTNWTEEAKLIASDGAERDMFGYSVSLDGDTALIGAHKDDDSGINSGSAYLFKPLNGNGPPHAPDIDGQISGSAGTEYRYTFNAVDLNKDDVKYYIDWGDGGSQTTAFSPSGTDVKVKHTWSKQGTYTIKAKAKDIHGLVGPEGLLKVTMPRNRATSNVLFYRFLEQFPILQKILLLYLIK
jgi:hypothetical protein